MRPDEIAAARARLENVSALLDGMPKGGVSSLTTSDRGDVDFIVNAPDDLRKALDEIERLHGVLDESAKTLESQFAVISQFRDKIDRVIALAKSEWNREINPSAILAAICDQGADMTLDGDACEVCMSLSRRSIEDAVAILRKAKVPGPYVINAEPNEISPGIVYNTKPGTGFVVTDDEGNIDEVLLQKYLVAIEGKPSYDV